MTLRADVHAQVGEFRLDLAFDAQPGEVIAVLGPNGAGKSTLLRVLAGLTALDDGELQLGDAVFDSPAQRRFVRAEDRSVGVVFQQYLLFPHLSALDNVAFGLRARGRSKSAARTEALAWLERFGVASHASAKPAGLSGGQAQRVALARALAVSPELLLLDEPLAALDASTRSAVRRDLSRHLTDFPGICVVVTHDPLDALALADRICVLEGGRVTQFGAIGEVTSRPRTRYVADLLGVNLLAGRGEGSIVRLENSSLAVSGVVPDAGGSVVALIRPASVSLHHNEPDTSARNRWKLTVSGLDLLGDRVRVHLSGDVSLVAEVTAATMSEFGLVEGAPVWASVKATDIEVYPA